MGMQCPYCGKKPVKGRTIARRGKAKYLGGVGKKVTGISTRRFKPNLQNVKILDANGTIKRVRICVKCLRSGVVQRPVKQKPFQVAKGG